MNDVHELLFDSTFGDSFTSESGTEQSSTDSDSDYDLSDPESGLMSFPLNSGTNTTVNGEPSSDSSQSECSDSPQPISVDFGKSTSPLTASSG